MKRTSVLHLLVIGAMLFTLLPMALPAAAQGPGEPGGQEIDDKELQPMPEGSGELDMPQVQAPAGVRSPEEAIQIIDPELRDEALAGGPELVKITLLALPGSAVERYFERLHVVQGPEFDRYVGLVPAGNLLKMATVPGTLAVLNMEERQPPQPPDPFLLLEDMEPPERIEKTLDSAQPQPMIRDRGTLREVVEGEAPESFFSNDANGVWATWAMGITGDGADGVGADHVKLAVVDTGVDMANPDLYGAQARVMDPNSPYFDPAGFGWPIAFDDRSMSDYILDIQDYRGNWGWYMNAYVTIQDPDLGSLDPFNFTVMHPDLGVNVTYVISSPIQSFNTNGGMYRFGWHPDDSLTSALGETPGVLVSGEAYFGTTWGTFDTVYVDMLGDYEFDAGAADGWATLGQEIACVNLGWSPPGYCDLSGGLAYWIANGTTPVPASDWLYGAPPVADPGSVVAFMLNDFTENGGDHGTLCAGTAVGRGNIYQMPYAGTYGSTYWPPEWYDPQPWPTGDGGISQGPGRDTWLVPMGNYYAGGSSLNYYDFAALGYDGVPAGDPLDAKDQPHIYTNSYGSGSVENDGWNLPSRYVTLLNYGYSAQQGIAFPDGGDHAPLFVGSTGNSGFGYGTVTSPQPVSAVMAGVETVFGQFNLGDKAIYRDWVNWGQLGGFSDRGPTSMSTIGTHILANGFFGSGDLPLNQLTGGAWAVDYWSGTSRSAPEAGGVLALIYDAFWQAHGRYPTWKEARTALMNGARTAFNDPFAQGAGLLDAINAVEIITGTRGVMVANSEGDGYWTPGDYRGTAFAGFARGLFSGDSDTEIFTVTNYGTDPVTVDLEAVDLEMYEKRTWDFTTLPLAQEGGAGYYVRRLYGPPGSNIGYGAADAFFNSTDPGDTALLQDADLMVVQLAWPQEQFGENISANWLFLYAFAWRDVNADDTSYTDTNGNGYVNGGESQPETVRMNYDYHGNSAEIRIRQPWDLMQGQEWPNEPDLAAMTDILIMPRHFYRGGFDTTELKISVELYKETPWGEIALGTDQLTVGGGAVETFEATAHTIVPVNVYLEEDFEGTFPPAGWQVLTNTVGGAWDRNDALGQVNHTTSVGGSGFSAANGLDGTSGTAWDTELWSPPVALGAGGALLEYASNFQDYAGNGEIWLDVTTDGGATWTNLRNQTSDDPTGGTFEQTDLSAYAGQTIMLRWRYQASDSLSWYWQIDNVAIREVEIEPPGEYTGYIKLTYSSPYTYYEYVPVTKQIWFPSEIDPVLGGVDQPYPYDNGMMFGARGTSASGERAESGDWRFFYTDVTSAPAPGTYLLTHTYWLPYGTPPDATDIDTIIYAPEPTDPLFAGHGGIFGPHGLAVEGGSLRAGSAPDWEYYTTTGGPSDWNAIQMEYEGLYGVAAQVVRWGGAVTQEPFTITVGTVEATPEVALTGLVCTSCTVPISFKTNHADLEGMPLEAVGYGFTQPVHEQLPVTQGSYTDYFYTITAEDALSLDIYVSNPDPGTDIDLEVYYDGQLVGSSGRSDSNEHVLLPNPPPGEYRIALYGYAIPAGTATANLDVYEVSGAGAMTVTGLPSSIELGMTYDLEVHFQTTPEAGEWAGTIYLGPEGSPTAVAIPVHLNQGAASKVANVDTVSPGELVTFTITLHENPGDTVIWNVTDPIPAGFQFVDVDGATYDPGTDTVYWSNATMPMLGASTPLTIVSGSTDDGYGVVSMPFPFNLFTDVFTAGHELKVSTNGYATFGIDGTDYSNDAIPSTTDPDEFIAPFWDDQETDAADPNQGMWYDVHPTAGGDVLAVEWLIQDLGTATQPNHFQAQVYESGDVWFVYGDMNEARDGWGNSATIGLENVGGTAGFQYSYNTASIADNYAIGLTPDGAGNYSQIYAGPNATPFGSHTITLTLQTVASGYLTNEAFVDAGDCTCVVSDTVIVAEVIPEWDKEVWINGMMYAPGDSPFEVAPGDEVVVVDHVIATGEPAITYTLTEEWTDVLMLVDYDADAGTVVPGSMQLDWMVDGLPADTWYTLTKTFVVDWTGSWAGTMTETLDVEDGPGAEVRIVEFEIPAVAGKMGPAEAVQGEVITYTLTFETPGALMGSVWITDALPAGVEYADALTYTYGTAVYDAADNAVYWEATGLPLPLPAPGGNTEAAPPDARPATTKAGPADAPPMPARAPARGAIQDVVLEEGFEGGVMPPAGWAVIDSATATRHWTLVDAATYPNFVRTGTYAAWCNWEAADQDEWLISPVIDLSGLTNPSVDFWVYANNNWVGNAELQLLALDPGGAWQDTLWQQSGESWAYPSVYHNVVVDLSAYTSAPVQLAWRYVGNDGDSVALDDIVVTGEAAAVPSLITATFQVTVTADPGAEVVNEVTADYHGMILHDDHGFALLGAGLYLTKTGTLEQVPGLPVTYTLAFGAGGPSDAAGVTLSDTLPAGVEYAGSDLMGMPGAYDPVAHVVSWDGLDLVAGDPMMATIVVTLSAEAVPGTWMTNTAYVFFDPAMAVTGTFSHYVEMPPDEGFVYYLPIIVKNW